MIERPGGGENMDYSAFKVLIVEDDPEIARLVQRCLEEATMPAIVAGSNAEARKVFESTQINMAIVDLGLPDGDGLALARDISARGTAGVIILTGRMDVTDKIIGLEMGADDYVTKPFERRELTARVKSLARRLSLRDNKGGNESWGDDQIVTFNGWTLHRDKMQIVHEDGRAHDLTASEYSLLQIFLERPGRILSRDQIMDCLYVTAAPAFDRSIDVRVSRLRTKLEDDPKHPTLIVTARNVGYVFRGKVA